MYKSSVSKSTALIILGMHRSGTSCLAGSLQQNGLYLGEVTVWADHNLKGKRENKQIWELNEAVLATNNSSWDFPPMEDIIWTDQQSKRRDEIIVNFSNSPHHIWGFKDPRVLFTLKFWIEGLANFKLVASYRHPMLVARSLRERNIKFKTGDMSLEDGLQLWKAYNQRLLIYLEEYNFPLISFDISKNDYMSCNTAISERIGISKLRQENQELFFENQLINQKLEDHRQNIPDDILSIYTRLNKYFMEQDFVYLNNF